MGHAKSMSWHVSPTAVGVPDDAYIPFAIPMSPAKGSRPRKRPRKISDESTTSSIEEESFAFPRRPASYAAPDLTTSDDDAISVLSSPRTSDAGLFSPFIISTQPTLQELFISLANKERRALEARELLGHAEEELQRFKAKWKTSLGVEFGSSSSSDKDANSAVTLPATCAPPSFVPIKGAIGLHSLLCALKELAQDLGTVIDDDDIIHGIESAFCTKDHIHAATHAPVLSTGEVSKPDTLSENSPDTNSHLLSIFLHLFALLFRYSALSSASTSPSSSSSLSHTQRGLTLHPLYPSALEVCYGALMPGV